MKTDRQPYLDRAYDAAELTIPHLLTRHTTKNAELYTPWQSVGADGVNTLSGKLLLGLMPPANPFFRLRMDPKITNELDQVEGGADVKVLLERSLSNFEQTVMNDVNVTGDRTSLVIALKHLLIAGNVAMYMPPKGQMQLYKLDQYTVLRDRAGNVLRLIIKEEIARGALPAPIADVAKPNGTLGAQDEPLSLYTVVERMGDFINVYQEIEDVEVPGSRGNVPVESSPYLALRWSRIDGESYGRGRVEEYQGDIQSLEGLSKALVEGASAASRLLIQRDPNAQVQAETVESAENGDIIDAAQGDLSFLQVNKMQDFSVASSMADKLEKRIGRAFMVTSSIQRDAERVTAEEIRQLVSDLEDTLGGAFSILAQEFQLPYVKRRIAIMQKRGDLPQLPSDEITPSIVTGLEAIGRNQELNKAVQWARLGSEVLGPETFASTISTGRFLAFLGTNLGFVEASDITKTDGEKQAENQAQQQQQMLQQLGPALMQNRGA